MKLYFVTGNINKFNEAKEILGEDLEQLEIDLVEIQESSAEKIVEHKLKEALKNHPGPLVVDDVSLELEALKGFPGPYTKWMEKTVGVENVYEIAKKLGNTKAKAKTILGVAMDAGNILFFEGEMGGELTLPKGENGFGFDVIFKPYGSEKNYGELTLSEKNEISHRGKAFRKLKEFLKNGRI